MGVTCGGCGDSTASSKNELIELTYFDFGYGRADPLVQLLVHTDANWQYKGETFESWGARKQKGQTAEFGALPIVKKGNRTFDLSIPALRSLGMEFGYYPSDDFKKAATVDMICETYSDIFNLWAGTLVSQDKSDAQKKDVFTLSLADNEGVAWKFFNMITKVLQKNGGKRFLAGDKVTIADCCMVSLLFNYVKNPVGPMKDTLQPLMRAKFPRVMSYANDLEREFSKNLRSRKQKPF